MNVRELKRLAAGTAVAALAVWGLASGAAVSPAAEAGVVGGGSQEGQSATAYLDYREVGYSVVSSMGVRVATRTTPFPKEPAFKGGKVSRGMLLLADGGTNEVAFAWDQSAGKLYLDLNRNLNLSDDTGGVFECHGRFREDFQTFNNLHLPLKTAAGTRPMLVHLTMNGIRRLMCTVALQSFWSGKVTLQGEAWEVGLVPGARQASMESGSLLLRPWAEREQGFSADSYQESSAAFPFSRWPFFGGRAYELQCTNVVEGDTVRVQVRFAEQNPKLGEVKIAGDFVRRVTMKGSPYFVVLDRPGASAQVPAGSYSPIKVWLKKGTTEAHFKSNTGAGSGRQVVGEKKPVVLMVGGPLTNSVSISRRGKSLSLRYELIGAGGPYELENVDRSHPPEFAVYKGEKKVASGRFEYG